MDKKTKATVTLLMKSIGFPKYLFMRLLSVYFLLSDITLIWAGGRGISARKNYVTFIGLFPIRKLLIGYVGLFVAASTCSSMV